MYNARLSKDIFQELINGKVINKYKLDNASNFVDNPLFQEIMANEGQYRQQYEMAGYEFNLQSDFVFIREPSRESGSLKTDVVMKVYVLLMVIAKYLNDNNYRFSKLTDANSGIGEDDFASMEELPDTQELLEKTGLKGGLDNSVRNLLVKRNILLERPGSASYILSNAGRAFFDEILDGGFVDSSAQE